jgi:hypothetical protein
LAAKFFKASTLGISLGLPCAFNLVEQQAASDKAIESLLPRLLALHLNPCRQVDQHYASGGLVDVLPAMAAGANEGFFEIAFTYAERGHSPDELSFLLEADGERAHPVSLKLTAQRVKAQATLKWERTGAGPE